MSNNFKIFNQSLNNALTDSQYANSQDRINGVLGELAKSTVHNKLFAQTSVAAYALAKFVSDHGRDALDRDPDGFSSNIELTVLELVNSVVSDRVPSTRASATSYSVGDVADSPYIPRWGELECITAGTTAATDVINGVTVAAIGQQVNDGTVVWAVRAKRFQTLLNVPVPFSGLWSVPVLIGEPSYPIHPEIGLPMWDCRLCDGTNGTIDMRDRFLMASDRASEGTAAGADSVTLAKKHLPTDTFNLSLSMSRWDHKFNLQGNFASGGQSVSHTHQAGDATFCGTGGFGVKTAAGTSTSTGPASNDHTHVTKVEFNNIDVGHVHGISGTVRLNSSQQAFSTVSKHYKMTYIQRIY